MQQGDRYKGQTTGDISVTDITCAILAGGRSTRMRQDKATLKVCHKTLIQKVYDKAQLIFGDIIIVSSHHQDFYGINAHIIKDIIPIQSSMVGIVSGLLAAKTPYVFVLACDMPFITIKSIKHVLGEIHGEDIIIPRTENGFEPLHAAYNRSCISALLTLIGQQCFRITKVFPYVSVREVGNHPVFIHERTSVFANINVREDLSLLQRFGNG